MWTGRELIGWGGGCCGDAFSDGSAYNPGTNRWRRLPRSPLAGSQHPLMAWTGREVIVIVGSTDADGKPVPARFARAAAYDPARNKWRRLAAPPASVASGTRRVRRARAARRRRRDRPGRGRVDRLRPRPGWNRWRRLASMPAGRTGSVGTWNGTRLLLVGGVTGRSHTAATRSLAYDPRTNRWSYLPRAPLPAKLVPTAAWTGHTLLVFGATPTATWGHWTPAGAALRPRRLELVHRPDPLVEALRQRVEGGEERPLRARRANIGGEGRREVRALPPAAAALQVETSQSR